jgi:hypothetical protein
MPDTSRGYTYPASTGSTEIWTHFEELADDINTDVDALAKPPVGRIVAGSGTQALADDTQVAIQFPSADDIDTADQHNPASNNTRITPNVAGYYRFYGTTFFSDQVTPVYLDINFRKNGSTHLAPGARSPGSTQVSSLAITALVSMNGSTDYIEMMARQNSAGADSTQQSAQFSSVIEWEYVREL